MSNPIPFQRKPHFSDRQIPRVLLTLLAAFSGYQIRTGRQQDGTTRFMDVPVIYGGMERTVEFLLRGGNENTISYVPMASLYMTDLQQNANLRHTPTMVESIDWIEPMRTDEGAIIIDQPGRRITMDRAMPVPYTMKFEVAFWCSNEDQGLQMIEQIGAIYNPGCDLLISNAPTDWTKMTTIIFDGQIRQERVIPDTNANPLYVYTFPFTMDFWLSLPVKLYETNYIYEIHVPIGEITDNFSFDSMTDIQNVVVRANQEDILNIESISWPKK